MLKLLSLLSQVVSLDKLCVKALISLCVLTTQMCVTESTTALTGLTSHYVTQCSTLPQLLPLVSNE